MGSSFIWLFDDPLLPTDTKSRNIEGTELHKENAGLMVLIIDANQVWGIKDAIEHVKGLEDINLGEANFTAVLTILASCF